MRPEAFRSKGRALKQDRYLKRRQSVDLLRCMDVI